VDQVPHPVELSKLGSRWAFSAAAVLVGFVAFVVGRGRRRVIRVALASTVLVATAAVALTRLYLGVRCLTDIGGGLLLGGAAVVTRVA
jgi:undecaprenyl-diphosphatase